MKIYDPPINLVTKIIDFIFHCQKKEKSVNGSDVLAYVERTKGYVYKGINFLLDFGLLIKHNDDSFVLNSKAFNQLESNEKTINQILIELIISIKPFVEYVSLLNSDKSKEDVIKIIKFTYEIEEQPSVIQKTFDKWLEMCNIKINILPQKIEIIEQLQESFENIIKANLFLKEVFADNYQLISKQVLDDLAKAIIAIKIDTSESITDAGRAFEDFLRIDLAPHIDLTNCSGIGQIADILNQRQNRTEFPSKLNNISKTLGNIRSMGDAHGVDRELNARWIIKEETAMIFILNIISVINSFIDYREKGFVSY